MGQECVGGSFIKAHLSDAMVSCPLSPTGVCGCCGALRPRYKRLVDNIFPEDPEVKDTEAAPRRGCV